MLRTGIAPETCEMTAERLSCWPPESRTGFGHRLQIKPAQRGLVPPVFGFAALRSNRRGKGRQARLDPVSKMLGQSR